jgi:hypothetical protein
MVVSKYVPNVSEAAPPPELEAIQLPAIRRRCPLRRVLQLRQTTRHISERALPRQIISELLWAAWGVNRKHGPFGSWGRTAASASNSQEIDLYVALPQATYRYDAAPHRLTPVAEGDLRTLALSPGQPDSAAGAPLRLIYVVDIERLVHTSGFQEPGLRDPEVQRSYYYVATGLIAAHVYLYAAAAGLAAWFHNCDRQGVAARLRLSQRQRVLFAQTVGYAAQRARKREPMHTRIERRPRPKTMRARPGVSRKQ